MARKKTNRLFPEGTQWFARSREMLESPAWRALPDNARRVLERLEIEHMAHGGAENGSLICTYDEFEAGGVRRASVATAIRQCVALGFLKVKAGGYSSNHPQKPPNIYFLTYARGRGKSPNPTDDWAKIDTGEEAMALLATANTPVTPDRKSYKPELVLAKAA